MDWRERRERERWLRRERRWEWWAVVASVERRREWRTESVMAD